MKIVVTGGPSAGKTAITQTIQKEFLSSITVVPEAASILFGGGFPRENFRKAIEHQQIAIYHVQKELEFIFSFKGKNRLLICDRGSLDGAAYWPGSSQSFFKAIGSNLTKELNRYDYVIHLDTASKEAYDYSNPVRRETWVEAEKMNTRIKSVWKYHPQRFVIPNHTQFSWKIQIVHEIILHLLLGKDYKKILSLIQKTYDIKM